MTEIAIPTVSRWRTTAIASVLLFAILLALFWPTAQGMAYIWYNFETYTHGFLILPISLWLVWQKRRHLAAFTPQPTPAFLLLVAGCAVAWVLARLTGVLVIEQAAFVGIVITGLAAVLGWQVSKFLAFPLLFLFFAVPMGEDLVPPMMEFTATFTVEALRLTGIPVYRDGLWFSLPSGNWSVVEACSGVRYLIASVTLGFMYAYITYHTLWKRVLFILMSALVPIFANGVRAYMIVMIGHLSEMEYATGVDHLIYGWFFFGVVMFILFWIGSFWQEQEASPAFVAPPRVLTSEAVSSRVMATTLAVLAMSASAVWLIGHAESAVTAVITELRAPDRAGEWQRQAGPATWSAAHQPTEHVIAAEYRGDGGDVQLHVVLFPHQRQGAEAISQDNKLSADLVRMQNLGGREASLGDAAVRVNTGKATLDIGGAAREYLVWQWYRVAGFNLSNRYVGKAREAIARIYPGRADGAWIAISTPFEPQQPGLAEQRLESFARQISPALDTAIDRTVGIGH